MNGLHDVEIRDVTDPTNLRDNFRAVKAYFFDLKKRGIWGLDHWSDEDVQWEVEAYLNYLEEGPKGVPTAYLYYRRLGMIKTRVLTEEDADAEVVRLRSSTSRPKPPMPPEAWLYAILERERDREEGKRPWTEQGAWHEPGPWDDTPPSQAERDAVDKAMAVLAMPGPKGRICDWLKRRDFLARIVEAAAEAFVALGAEPYEAGRRATNFIVESPGEHELYKTDRNGDPTTERIKGSWDIDELVAVGVERAEKVRDAWRRGEKPSIAKLVNAANKHVPHARRVTAGNDKPTWITPPRPPRAKVPKKSKIERRRERDAAAVFRALDAMPDRHATIRMLRNPTPIEKEWRRTRVEGAAELLIRLGLAERIHLSRSGHPQADAIRLIAKDFSLGGG